MITSEVLMAYIQCSRKAFLLYCKKEKGMSHEYSSILEEKSRQNRVKHLNRIKAKIQETESYSSSGMKKGIPVLLEANLEFDGLAAYADVLTKIEELSSHKRYYYVPTLVVGTHKLYKEQKLQLAFIGYVLSKLQKKKSDTGILVEWGDKSHTIKLEPFYKEVEQAIRELKTWTSSPQTEEIPIILNKYCHYCQFRKECVSKAKEQDNLSLLNRMSEKEITALKKKGIFTVTQYSYTYRPRKRGKEKENQSPKYYHSLQALAIREKKIYIVEKAEIRQTTTQMFLDVEGIPDQDFYYLIGLLIVERDSIKKFSYWANDQNEEEKIWRDFLGVVTQYGEFSLFHYGKYEIQFIERMNKRYGKEEDQEFYQKILSNMVNVLSLIYAKIYFPTYSNGLKDIGKYLGANWTEESSTGLQSLVWRHQWEIEVKKGLKETLLQYNMEDVFALKRIVEVIVNILNEDNEFPATKVDDIKRESYLKWGKTDYQSNDFKIINQCAYFDYQRNKIYLRTNKRLKKVVKRKTTIAKKYNKIDKTVILPIQICPNCNYENVHRLNSPGKIIIDLKFIKNGIIKWVTHLKGNRFICPNCKKGYSTINFKKVSKYGNDLMAWSVNQYVTYRVGLNKVSDMLQENFNIMIPNNNIYRFKSILSQKYKTTLTEIMKDIIEGSLIHADETDLNVRGFSSSYIWVFTNMESVFYLFKPTRDASFLEELLKGFQGVLVSDFYPGYDTLDCHQQKCLIHLIRDLNENLFKDQFNNELKNIVVEFGRLLRKIIDTVDRYGLKRRNLNKHNKDVEKFYKEIISKDYKTEIAASYQKRFLKNKEKLFTFLNYDGIPWNNNNAEHAIKPFARFRRDADGVLTEKSINEYLILLSVQQTCKYRGISFLDFLRSQETSINQYSKKH